MVRTTVDAVILALGKEYDTINSPDLTPYLELATEVVGDVVSCATDRGVTISTARQELLERFLTAHYYNRMDPSASSRSTLSASASFTRDPKVPEPFKAMAISADPSGCLLSMLDGSTARVTWLGKVPSEQIPYDERD